MKFTTILVTFLSLLLFTACQKEETNCRDGVIGTYSSPSTANYPAMEFILKAGGEDKEVVITWTAQVSSTPQSYVLEGELNSNCSILKIIDQPVGPSATYNGTLTFDDDKLVGTMVPNDPNINLTIPVNFTKE
ncbi:MAG: hypothetical protein ACRBFS_15870 [Aureispira sp.]